MIAVVDGALVEEDSTTSIVLIENRFVTRDLYGTMWYFYDDSNGLYFETSLDNGTTWANKTEILAPGWEGTTYIRPMDVVLTSNNTIVVLIRTNGYDNAMYEHLILEKHNGSSTWTETVIYSNAGQDSADGRMGINHTNHILITYRLSSNNGYTVIYDFDGDSLGVANLYVVFTNVHLHPVANMSGDFYLAWGFTSAIKFRDLNKTIAEETTQSNRYVNDLVCLQNDVFVVMNVYSFGVNDYVYFNYRTGLNTWFNRRIVDLAPPENNDWEPRVGGLTVINDTAFSVYAWNNDDYRLYAWGPFQYDADEVAVWRAGQTAIFYDNDFAQGQISGWGQLYPRVDGVRINVPDSGWGTGFIDEDAADFDFFYNGSNLVWPEPPWEEAPAGPGGPGDGPAEETIADLALWWSDAGCITAFAIAAGS
jgi:hypothetical protein